MFENAIVDEDYFTTFSHYGFNYIINGVVNDVWGCDIFNWCEEHASFVYTSGIVKSCFYYEGAATTFLSGVPYFGHRSCVPLSAHRSVKLREDFIDSYCTVGFDQRPDHAC